MKDNKGKTLAVHPFAARFPMMSEWELQELAEDMKINGQKHPVVRDTDGTLLDGRNRSAAAKLAGLEVASIDLKNGDPIAFILSVNLRRRHLSQGQRAMLAALGFSDSEKGITQMAKESDVSQARMGQACVILKYNQEDVEGVINSTVQFDVAYEKAKQNKAIEIERNKRMAILKKEAPDLWGKAEEDSDLEDVWAKWERRQAERAQEEKDTKQALKIGAEHFGVTMLFAEPVGCTVKEKAVQLLESFDPQTLRIIVGEITPERLKKCAAVLLELAARWEK